MLQFLGLRKGGTFTDLCGFIFNSPSYSHILNSTAATVDRLSYMDSTPEEMYHPVCERKMVNEYPKVVCSLFLLPRSKEHSLCREICYKLLTIPLRIQHFLLLN